MASDRRGHGTVRGKTASFNLSPAALAAIDALMTTGDFPSRSAVVDRAVRLLLAVEGLATATERDEVVV